MAIVFACVKDDLRGTDFSGLVLYSSPEGKLILGAEYEQGVRVRYLVPEGSTLQPNSCCETEGDEACEDHDHAADALPGTAPSHGIGHAYGHANGNNGNGNGNNGNGNGNNGNAYGHDKPNNGQGNAYGRMKQVGSVVIELVDEATATPAYMMSWEDPWDGGWIDPIDVVACGCGHCSGGCYSLSAESAANVFVVWPNRLLRRMPRY